MVKEAVPEISLIFEDVILRYCLHDSIYFNTKGIKLAHRIRLNVYYTSCNTSGILLRIAYFIVQSVDS